MSGNPTLRRKRLARRLRELRDHAGKTAEDAAAEAKHRSGRVRGWSVSKLVRLEKAEWKRLRLDDLDVLLAVYGVTDRIEIEACRTLAREGSQRGWWAPYDDVLGSGQFVGLEAEARSIRTWQPGVIPGLLQTEDYARAMIHARGVVEEGDVARRVEARMIRKHVLARSDPPTLWAVVDEAALLRIPPDLSGQLDSLIEDSHRAHIGIQVMPLSRGLHAGMTGQLVIMEFPQPDPTVVYIEAFSEEIYLEKPNQIAHYQHIYDHVQAEALSVDDSRDYIRSLLTDRK